MDRQIVFDMGAAGLWIDPAPKITKLTDDELRSDVRAPAVTGRVTETVMHSDCPITIRVAGED